MAIQTSLALEWDVIEPQPSITKTISYSLSLILFDFHEQRNIDKISHN